MSDTPIICGHCRERIHSMSGARHFGHFMAHQESECLSILLAKVAAVTAERDALLEIKDAAQNLIDVKGRHNTAIAYERLAMALRRP